MAYKAQVVLDIDFPIATSLEEAQTTLDIWIDLIAPILNGRIHWEEVNGLPAYKEETD
jgi:hypothetical protein